MNEFNLSSDARHRLWQCYSLLLRLADQAEKDAADSKIGQGQKPAAPTVNALSRPLDDDSQAVDSEQSAKTRQTKK